MIGHNGIGNRPLAGLDKLLAMHPEILREENGGKEHDFVFLWFHRDSATTPEAALKQSYGVLFREFGQDFGVGQREYPERRSTLVAVWRKGYVDETSKSGDRGEKYLPDGRIVEWELDADGKPRTLKIDGESVDPSLLSKAKTFDVEEKIIFDAKADMMTFE